MTSADSPDRMRARSAARDLEQIVRGHPAVLGVDVGNRSGRFVLRVHVRRAHSIDDRVPPTVGGFEVVVVESDAQLQ